MRRVHVFVEGQTEETFVRDVLRDYLYEYKVDLNAILVKTSATGKGGVVSYAKLKPQLKRKCLQDPTAIITTMIDYFRLPNDFPGQSSVPINGTCFQKVAHLEHALGKDINQRNFHPYLQLHEFEALLFSDIEPFLEWCGQRVVEILIHERSQYSTPEEINDGPKTAPSKRLMRHCPSYEKPWHGPMIAMDIGLDKVRKECKHFDAWVGYLLELATR